MQNLSMEMPIVNQCSVSAYTYNTDVACRAQAITIGNTVHPGCDTYFTMSGSHAKAKQWQAGVGAYKMSDCQHNDDYECMADKISVGQVKDRIDCLDIQPTRHLMHKVVRRVNGERCGGVRQGITLQGELTKCGKGRGSYQSIN